ncbi:MAG: hypothetical protein IJ391_02455 [Clostridia bacterium]|nr:hypothetical protein [Clostridia bacterium]
MIQRKSRYNAPSGNNTKEDIENCEIDDTDYICNDDNVLEELIAIRNMTDEEFDKYQCEVLKKEYVPYVIVNENENIIGFKSDAPTNAKRAAK